MLIKYVSENYHDFNHSLTTGHKLFVKNKAKNPLYLINYTFTGENFGKVIEALESHNAVLMALVSFYQVTNDPKLTIST